MTKNKYFYPAIIFLVWLIAYIISQIVFDQKLGWDEISYMSVARGIAEDFNFSARSYTIMGLIKHGYPSHFINFPVYSFFLAIFFKLFGVSHKVAYFSTWLCALGICLMLYYIFLLIKEGSNKFAFLISMSYLLCPGMIRFCDTAMMEQCGNLLLCIFLYLILRDYKKGVFNFFTILKFSFSFLVLWLYKSLYLGIFIGALLFIIFAYSSRITGKEIKTRFSLPVFLSLSYGIFGALFILLKKFLFLPVAPMMTFTPRLENSQVYADFLGGFFQDIPGNLLINIRNFWDYILGQYFVYPAVYEHPNSQFFVFLPFVFFIGIYFFMLFIGIVLVFAFWKKFSAIERVFISLTLGSIISFNLIFNVFFTTTYENVWRYNIYYLPLYLIFLMIVFLVSHDYKIPFIKDHPYAYKSILCTFFVFLYLPLFLSILHLQEVLWDGYHIRAKTNDELIKQFLKEDKPAFIYLNDGAHASYTMYPMKRIIKDATNEQLLKVNKILPEPVKYLFLRPGDWLFQSNKEKIVKGEPILDSQYKLYGYSQEAQIVVYKLSNE